MNLQELIDIVDKYNKNSDDQEFIKKAYTFACSAHRNQLRATGEPFIVHPFEVAKILANDNHSAAVVAAALLHDVVEDTSIAKEKIQSEFGNEIADLVDGLTKLQKIKIKKSWLFSINPLERSSVRKKEYELHLENLRKMLVAMTKDIRIIFIKLADRLHNMQTLYALPQEKQQQIAEETLEIYAPIAHRLGMGKLKGELEDLAFHYVYPSEFEQTKKIAGREYANKEKYMEKAKYKITEALKENSVPLIDVSGRKKHLYSLRKKLKKHDNDIEKIYDIVAVRIIVDTTENCYKTLGIIHKLWRPLIGRIKDYIAMPKPNGYQSLHTTVFGPNGSIIEIQIRTPKMHDKAEKGIAAHWNYKTTQKPIAISKENYSWINELGQIDTTSTDKKEWSEILKLDFFKDRIFVFTPTGDVHNLPSGATPVDFAYSIHTEVGNTTVGAKVNGHIVKINYQLQNGDIVDIIRSKKSNQPKRDWLKFVKTSRARDKIKNKLLGKSKLPFIN